MYAIGFDYGNKRMGVAVGQTFTATAQPLTTLPVHADRPDWIGLNEIIRTWQPQALVVGLPKHADDSDSSLTHAVYHFAQQLQERYRLPVHLINERLSSYVATQRQATSTQKKFRKEHLDAVAAQIILETWFAEQTKFSVVL